MSIRILDQGTDGGGEIWDHTDDTATLWYQVKQAKYSDQGADDLAALVTEYEEAELFRELGVTTIHYNHNSEVLSFYD